METKDDKAVLQLPLTQIFIDYSWNSRSQHDVVSAQSDGAISVEDGFVLKEGNGFHGLCTSIQASGQDSPIVIRPVFNNETIGGKRVGQGMPPYQNEPYELICGFRRYTALVFLNQKKAVIPGLKPGHVMAMVRELSHIEARLLNMRENTDRSSLLPADLVWGIIQLQSKNLKGVQIAEHLNVTAQYVSKLSKIAALPFPVIEHWRGGSKVKLPGIPLALNGEPVPTRSLSHHQMFAIAETLADDTEKQQMYVNLVLGKKAATMASGGTQDATEERIIEIAKLAGDLVNSGVLAPGSLQWSKVIGPKKFGFLISSGHPGSNPSAWLNRLWKLAEMTYNQTVGKKEQ